LLLPVVLFLAGLFLVVRGGDLFVEAAAWTAEVLGIPKFVVGATVVSLATTLPEILVSLFSSLEGSVDMAVGNAIGSVTVNTALIMGISILCSPAKPGRRAFAAKAVLMLVSAAVLCAFGSTGALGLAPSLLLMALFFAYVWESVHSGRDGRARTKKAPSPGRRAALGNAGKFALGALGIAVGAQLMVDQGIVIASALGVPESVIGVTLMGMGTALPELATTVAALRRREAAMSIGNIVGANVIDLTLILPLCALVSGKPLLISQQARTLDLPALGVIAAVAALPAVFGKKLRRAQGGLLILLYAAYLALLFLRL